MERGKKRVLFGLSVCSLLFAGASFLPVHAHDDDGNNEESKVQIGFAIATVPLSTQLPG